GGVQHQQGCVGGGFVLLAQYAHDFAEFVHQVGFVVQAACGVNDQHVIAFAFGVFISLESDGGGIGIDILGDHGDVQTLPPDFDLFDGGGAECVSGGQNDSVALMLDLITQLADRGGFADTVYACHQN